MAQPYLWGFINNGYLPLTSPGDDLPSGLLLPKASALGEWLRDLRGILQIEIDDKNQKLVLNSN